MGFRILRPLFPLGDVYLSAGVAALVLDPAEIDRLLNRHHCGDWGDLDTDDKRASNLHFVRRIVRASDRDRPDADESPTGLCQPDLWSSERPQNGAANGATPRATASRLLS